MQMNANSNKPAKRTRGDILHERRVLLGEVELEKNSFDKKKFFNGVLKAVCVSSGFLGLSYILCKLPELASAVGIEPKVMMISAITVYVTKSSKTLLSIFGIEKTQTEKVVEKVEHTVKEELEEEYLDM